MRIRDGGRRAVTALVIALGTALPLVATAGASAVETKVRARLLSAADLPSGFVMTQSKQTGTGGLKTNRCLSPLSHNAIAPASDSARRQFEDRSAGVALSEGLARAHPSVARWDRIIRQLSGCHQLTMTVKGRTLHLRTGTIVLPQVGERSHAYAWSTDVDGVEITFDLDFFETARYVGTIIYAGVLSPDLTTFETLATEAARKAATGSASS